MSSYLPRSITYIAVGILAVIINLVEIAFILWKHQITTFEHFFLSLVIADCICGIVLSTSHILFIVTGTFGNVILNAFTAFSLFSSITNLTAICFDRLLAIKYPLQHRASMTKRKLHL